MATDRTYIVGELRSLATWSHRGNAPVELAVLLDEAAAALAALPVEQQAATIDPNNCALDVYGRGESVGLFDIPKETANAICAGISTATGARVDWHYFGGRVHIKALPAAAQSAPQAGAAEVEKWVASLSNELDRETERAISQRDVFLKTGVSTASHGGSHDTCFSYIIRQHLTTFPLLPTEQPAPQAGAAAAKTHSLLRAYTDAVFDMEQAGNNTSHREALLEHQKARAALNAALWAAHPTEQPSQDAEPFTMYTISNGGYAERWIARKDARGLIEPIEGPWRVTEAAARAAQGEKGKA